MLECFASVSCIDPTCISGEIDGFVFQFLQICTQKLTASNDIVNQDLGKAPVEPFTFQNQIQNNGHRENYCIRYGLHEDPNPKPCLHVEFVPCAHCLELHQLGQCALCQCPFHYKTCKASQRPVAVKCCQPATGL